MNFIVQTSILIIMINEKGLKRPIKSDKKFTNHEKLFYELFSPHHP